MDTEGKVLDLLLVHDDELKRLKETAPLLDLVVVHDAELSKLKSSLPSIGKEIERNLGATATALAAVQAEKIKAELTSKQAVFSGEVEERTRFEILSQAGAIRNDLFAAHEKQMGEIRPEVVAIAKATAANVTKEFAAAQPDILSLVKKEFAGVESRTSLVNANKGEWNTGKTYNTGDIISFRGSSYLVLRPTVRGQFPQIKNQDERNPTYQILAAAGSPGPKGADGAGGGSGSGDVVGPASSTGNAISLFDGTTGKLIKNSDLTYSGSTLTVPASFGITGAGSLAFTAGGSNQNITLTPSGTGGANVVSGGTSTMSGTLTSPVNDNFYYQTYLPVFTSAGTSTDFRALNSEPTLGGTVGAGALRGFRSRPIFTGTSGTLTMLNGSINNPVHNGTALVTNIIGETTSFQFSAAGNATNAIFYQAAALNLTSTGVVTGDITGFVVGNIGKASATNTYGLNVLDQTASGTLTVGIRSQVTSGTGKYNVYADGTAQNYFAGTVTALSTIELGHATDTTLSRVSAGVVAIGGNNILVSGGALGTPSSGTLTNCTGLPQAGTVGLTTADSPQFTAVNVGHATDTTVARGAAGVLDIEGVSVLGGAEATVASATTTDIGAAKSALVSITGTTTITGFGTVAAGTRRAGRFTGALTLTHNATSLILPGGANITTAAGDRFDAVSLGSGNWVVYDYNKADGTAVVGGGGSSVYFTLTSGAALSLGDSTAYYYGITVSWAAATPNAISLNMPRAGTITRVDYFASYTAAGSAEDVNHYVRFNDTTDNCNAVADYDSANLSSSAVWTGSQAVSAGDRIVVKVLTPAWVTNPTNIRGYAVIYFTPS